MRFNQCGAWCHGHRKRCSQYPVLGRTRCRWHGGLSTGPRTAEGRAASFAARDAGRDRYLSLLKFFGEKRPSGRRKGAGWKTEAMWRRELAAAMALSPEAAARVAQEIVASRRIAEADAKLLELTNRIEANLEKLEKEKSR